MSRRQILGLLGLRHSALVLSNFTSIKIEEPPHTQSLHLPDSTLYALSPLPLRY